MQYKWIRSPSFWLSLSTPPVIVVAFGVMRFDPVPDNTGILAAFVLSLLLGGSVGMWIAMREDRIRAPRTGAKSPDGSSPSDQAAIYWDLFENATDIVFTTDLSGHFLAGNKAVQRLLGYTVEEAKSLTWEKLVAPYDMWKAKQMYKRHAAGEKHISFELDTVTASDEIKTFEIGSRPMFLDDKLCGFHAIARDITSRKEMQNQLQAARRDAEQANAAKTTFLANMSHEIRTPINGILGFLSLFAKTALTARQKEYLVPIEESAKHLLKIINDILDISKIEAGHFSIENEIFSYRDVVRSAVDLLRPLGGKKGLVVTTEFDDRIPRFVVGDGTRVGQIVSNLVSNAIKFTDSGSVSVHCTVTRLAALDLSIEVRVRDTGIGIAPGLLAKLFEPFQQLESTPNRKYPGTGLGLTISRNLVQAMGGEIRVTSEPGRFTEVTFELPLGLTSANPASAAADASRPFHANGLSAIIVDDNEINRWYLGAVLEQYGFEVHQADSGDTALEQCLEHEFDVVFMDIHMADMDGIETTRRLRAGQPRYRRVPAVAVSADVIGNKGARFTEQGLDYFLAKPIKEAALVDLLSRIFPACTGTAERDDATIAGASEPVDCVLDRAEGLELASNDESLWRRSVDVLREQSREILPQLRSAVWDGDHAGTRRLAHRLAGSAGYVAAREVARFASELEQAAGRREKKVMKRRLVELDRAVDRLMDLDLDTHF
jgi:PAS domain S-box-containing protein